MRVGTARYADFFGMLLLSHCKGLQAMLEPKRGRPEGTQKELPEDKIPMIIEGFSNTFVLRRAAGWASESPYHLKQWMDKGAYDAANEVDSLYAQLFFQVAYILSKKAAEYIKKLESCPKNSNGIIWLLEKCLRDDYGQESIEYKELLDHVNKLSEIVQRYIQNPLQHGARNHGREMDSKGD